MKKLKNRITTTELNCCNQYFILWVFRSKGKKEDKVLNEYIAHNSLRAERMMNLFLASCDRFDKKYLYD